MKKFVDIIINGIKRVQCVFDVHEYTKTFVGTSNVYRGNLLPRLILCRCNRCGQLELEVEMVVQKPTDDSE